MASMTGFCRCGEKHLVFVYGTLKRNLPNHFNIERAVSDGSATFIGLARTMKKFPLVVAGRFNVPFLLPRPDVGKIVVGEVYEVNDDTLQMLDKFEMCPCVYERQTIEVEMTGGDPSSAPKTCEVYFLTDFYQHLLETTFYEDYDASIGPYVRKTSSGRRPNWRELFEEVKPLTKELWENLS